MGLNPTGDLDFFSDFIYVCFNYFFKIINPHIATTAMHYFPACSKHVYKYMEGIP